jgi:acyl carrier protein
MSQSTASVTEDKIRQYILEHYPVLDAKGLGNDDSLVGVLDSLAVLGLIGFIEPEFSVQLSPSDLTDENFGSINAIAALVHRLKDSNN